MQRRKPRSTSPIPFVGLRVTDQETSRVVAIHKNSSDAIVGAGCLLNAGHILTCRHVVDAALNKPCHIGATVNATLIGVQQSPLIVSATVVRYSRSKRACDDLALLSLTVPSGLNLIVPTVEFASPLRYNGKDFAVFGFPGGVRQGRHAGGHLRATDAFDLIQMDGNTPSLVETGFSGAPVWSATVGAFVGLVVNALGDHEIAWCIPSRILCQFHPDLPVRFRVSLADRPQIHDYTEDDPNRDMFGLISDNSQRRLTARVKWNKQDKQYRIRVRYETLWGKPRGRYVTFLTYPDFSDKGEDAYELFAMVNEKGVAENEFYPNELFTVAAIGDGGDTALTLDLQTLAED